MMLGGSPMSVAVPPMFDAMISVKKYGTGLMSSKRHTVMVIGPIRRTVVTLSKNAERTAVSRTNRTMMVHGLPFAARAHLMARNSNTPDCLTTATNSIMPKSTPSVLKSICVTATSNDMMCRMSRSIAPTMATSARCTFSDMMTIMATTKIATEMIWLVSTTHRLQQLFVHGEPSFLPARFRATLALYRAQVPTIATKGRTS